MARIIYCHPRKTKYDYHIYTDLDFWDTRRIIRDLATVRRNFGNEPPGDEFPTQVVADGISRKRIGEIEKRIRRAIVSPPRHVIVRTMLFDKVFEFDPGRYYPGHWSPEKILRFTYLRLPLEQSALCSPYKTVRLSFHDGKVRVERVQREKKYDPVIRTEKDARRRLNVPSCF